MSDDRGPWWFYAILLAILIPATCWWESRQQEDCAARTHCPESMQPVSVRGQCLCGAKEGP